MRTLLSMGMGKESVAALLRWLLDPPSRVCSLEELTVITAMTGEEHEQTEFAMTRHVLPLMAEFGIHYVQLSRTEQSDTGRYTVLSDSRATERMVMRGPWRLFDEYRRAATVVQRGGVRKCSIRAKGNPIDWWVKDNIQGPYQHAIGFNADELSRVEKDKCYGANDTRNAIYPLVDFKWTRSDADAYIHQVTGAEVPKSACKGCAFAQGTELVCRWEREPADEVADVITMEHNALIFNPRAYLFDGQKSTAEIARDNGLSAVADLADTKLDAETWNIYEVRRVFDAKDGDPLVKGRAWRSIKQIGETCDRDVTQRALAYMAADRGAQVAIDRHGAHRVLLRPELKQEGQTYPAAESYLVAAVAWPEDKQMPGFEDAWVRATDPRTVAEDWGVYELRQTFDAKDGDPAKRGKASYSIACVARFEDGGQAHQALAQMAADRGAVVSIDKQGVHRMLVRPALRRPGQVYPAATHTLVVLGRWVENKTADGFAAAWTKATGEGPHQGDLFDLLAADGPS